MPQLFFQKAIATIFTLAVLGAACVSHAHEVPPTVMDPEGNVEGFTGFAQFTCFDDGNGMPDHLLVSIEDLSPPQGNLFVSVQVASSRMASSATDIVPGDGNASTPVIIHNGQGPYYVLINKTAKGSREFKLTYHCRTIDNIHTGTSDPNVFQFR